MFAQLFVAAVSVVDVAVKTVTSTVEVIGGQKTPEEAFNAVVETVTESPVVKSVTGLVKVATGEKNWEEYGTDLVESAKNTSIGRVVEGVVDIANGKDVGDALLDAAKKTSIGEAIDTTVNVISGETPIEEGVNTVVKTVAGANSPIATAVKEGSAIASGETSVVDGTTAVVQAVVAQTDPKQAREIGVVKEQLQNEPEVVSQSIDNAINSITYGGFTLARELIDSTGLTNMKERQGAAIRSFQKGNIGEGVQHALAVTPLTNTVANAVDQAKGDTHGAFGHEASFGAPKGKALTGITDAVLNSRTNGYYSKVRDLSDSTGLTDIKDQFNGGFDALMAGDLKTATEKLLIRSAVVPNVLTRMAEKGSAYWEDLALPSSKSVVALAEKSIAPLSDLGSGQRVREDAKAFIEDIYAGEFKQAANRARSLSVNAEQAGFTVGADTSSYIKALEIFATRGSEFDNLVDVTLNQYLQKNNPVDSLTGETAEVIGTIDNAGRTMEAGFGGVSGDIFDTDFITNPEVILPFQADVATPLLTDQPATAPIFDTDFITNPEVILPFQADVATPLLTDQPATAPIFNGLHQSDPTKPHHQDQFHAQHDEVLA